MGAGYHGGFGNTKGSQVRSKKLHADRQGKHIVGHKNYAQGKSIFSGTAKEAADLIEKYSGTGNKVGENKERVDFRVNIGYYVEPKTKKLIPTTVGMIHYSKNGAHIVPAQPKK